ncbi:MAG TPA: thioredoxin domain-containing protein [Sphingobium sp.]|uniref:DsbA family protein n=1 Tax=Sphingobium sp. TaxID=1912891 RepID=UPI002ED1C23A
MRALIAFIAALFLIGPAAAQLRTDWTRTVTITPGGTYVLGNPQATRLVEYVSYTCPHCAHFVGEASEPLRNDWVRKGTLSLEVRNAVRDPYDLAAAVLVRCGNKNHFFANHEAMFASQDAWMGRVQSYEAKRADMPTPKSASEQLISIATGTGLTDFFAKRGVTVEQQRTCLADKKTLDALGAMAKDAWEVKKIGGTPSFSVDGKMVDGAHDWNGLRPALPVSPK